MHRPAASTLAIPALAAVITTGLFLFMANLVRSPAPPEVFPGPKTSLDALLPSLPKSEPPPEGSRKTVKTAPSENLARPSPIAAIALPPQDGPVELIVPEEPVGVLGTGEFMTPGRGGRDLPVTPAAEEEGAAPLMPLLRREPAYPPEAARAGVEGWVELEFSVLPDGGVAEIRVLAARPRQLFEKSAMRALAGWKYQAMPGGEVRRGQRVRLDFRLEKAD